MIATVMHFDPSTGFRQNALVCVIKCRLQLLPPHPFLAHTYITIAIPFAFVGFPIHYFCDPLSLNRYPF